MGRPGFVAAPVLPHGRTVFVPAEDWDCNDRDYRWELLRPTDKGVFRAHMEPQESPEEPEEGPWGDAAYQAQMAAWRGGDVFFINIERAASFGGDNTPDEWEQGEDCGGFYGLEHAQQEAEAMLARAIHHAPPGSPQLVVDWDRELEVRDALTQAQNTAIAAYHAQESATAEFVRLARASGGVSGPGYATALDAQAVETTAKQAYDDATRDVEQAETAVNAYTYATPPAS